MVFLPVVLLTISNVFMTFAWYGHLRPEHKTKPLAVVIVVSWLIALLEYCFQVPANRIGHRHFSAAQLKVIQEVITLTVFAAFSVVYLREELRWNYLVGFGLIVGAVFFVFMGPGGPAKPQRGFPIASSPPSAKPGQGPQEACRPQSLGIGSWGSKDAGKESDR
jgi:uncharacterized protein (DUF486 family)